MTNLETACRAFGWAGGTIHQVAAELGMPSEGGRLVSMPASEFEALLRDHFAHLASLKKQTREKAKANQGL